MIQEITRRLVRLLRRNSRNLIIAAVGDLTRHTEWIERRPNFDLALISNQRQGNCRYLFREKGSKWNSIAKASREIDLKNYSNIWCPDEDISIGTDAINYMFNFFEYFKLNLAQPSLSRNGKYTLPISITNPDFILRYTNCVEVSCPIFDIDTFLLLAHTFEGGRSCSGYEWAWPKMLNYESVGIIDAVQVVRTNSSFSALETMRETEEKTKVLNEHGLDMNICIELKNVASRYIAGCDLAVSELNGITLNKLSKPCRRKNKCSDASTAISSRFIDFRKILQ